jgi:serine/threonine-protein kinase RCK2
MSTIQNIKNLLRHGKQAQRNDPPRDQPTTNVSPVHVQQQKYHAAISEPQLGHQKQQHYQAGVNDPGQFTVGGADNRNIAAQAGHAAAQAQGRNQKVQQSTRSPEIEAIVAEERAKASKMPKYPGLERFLILEKMGDGAFSNVYRARDTQTGQEVAIKVVRKFEMNNNQVCPPVGAQVFFGTSPSPLYHHSNCLRQNQHCSLT